MMIFDIYLDFYECHTIVSDQLKVSGVLQLATAVLASDLVKLSTNNVLYFSKTVLRSMLVYHG